MKNEIKKYGCSCKYDDQFGKGHTMVFQVRATNYANAIKKAKEKVPFGYNFKVEQVKSWIE